jgi:hypothetical protein
MKLFFLCLFFTVYLFSVDVAIQNKDGKGPNIKNMAINLSSRTTVQQFIEDVITKYNYTVNPYEVIGLRNIDSCRVGAIKRRKLFWKLNYVDPYDSWVILKVKR